MLGLINFLLVLLWLLVAAVSQKTPTSMPTYPVGTSAYCNQHGIAALNSTDYKPACVRCLKAGCGYCAVDTEDPSENYCYSYTDYNDPTYGTCSSGRRKEVSTDDRGRNHADEDYEGYCNDMDLGTVIVIIIFFYFLFPCICAAVFVSLFIKIYRSTCAPEQRVAPGNTGGPYEDMRGGRIPFTGGGQLQPQSSSPYENLTMADAKYVTAGAGGGDRPVGAEGAEGGVHEIPVVYAEAVPMQNP